ncbi:uracil-DNA glycosylase [Natronorubrum thiooxidans]|uniref:Uracil-DNA glycosylase, family 4 n=1 Tax=Natronorubrum thiooxidans TaxID=308853 RepID=A0A1N7GCC6_9EURY|nr:uracil-DNA glycosylase family protein [Natronorubrum thiooxidans]SIS10233.1 uracil-DNA glycosylase, family 4 [Natronorubrum thiooxidans]
MPAPDHDPAFPTTRNVLEADCERCPALTECRERISWGTGPLEATVVVVGEAPGYGDPDADRWRGGNWTGKAYTSRHSGRRIRRMLARLGYDETTYYTNAVKCFPASEAPRASSASSAERSSADSQAAEPRDDGETASSDSEEPETNREPTAEERATCRDHLLTELETVDPDVVLATGKHATKTVLAAEGRELEDFLESVLEPVWCARLDVWLVPILHPSYQDVWLGRLGYEPETYLEAIGETLADCRGTTGGDSGSR